MSEHNKIVPVFKGHNLMEDGSLETIMRANNPMRRLWTNIKEVSFPPSSSLFNFDIYDFQNKYVIHIIHPCHHIEV